MMKRNKQSRLWNKRWNLETIQAHYQTLLNFQRIWIAIKTSILDQLKNSLVQTSKFQRSINPSLLENDIQNLQLPAFSLKIHKRTNIHQSLKSILLITYLMKDPQESYSTLNEINETENFQLTPKIIWRDIWTNLSKET